MRSTIIPAIAHMMGKWPLATDLLTSPSYMLLTGQTGNVLNATDLLETDKALDSHGYKSVYQSSMRRMKLISRNLVPCSSHGI